MLKVYPLLLLSSVALVSCATVDAGVPVAAQSTACASYTKMLTDALNSVNTLTPETAAIEKQRLLDSPERKLCYGEE